MIATPQPFIVREECEKVAFEKGFEESLERPIEVPQVDALVDH